MAVSGALASGPVTVFFSSRASWTNNDELSIPLGTNTTPSRLTLDGQSRYNSVASGAAAWHAETASTNRATLTNAGGTGGSIYVGNTNGFITIRGFSLLRPTWGGVVIGTANPTLNIHDIIVENNLIDTPANNHGVWFGYAEAGCYNIAVSDNTIISTPLEAIYMGHYNYLADTITGTIIERNTIINAGTKGEGDIDIKGGNFGAIVRHNTSYSLATGHVLAGVVVMASDVQVYGNELRALRTASTDDGGHGIMLNADGDGEGHGKVLRNLLVYNNLVHGNAQDGIAVYATVPGASITGMKILNNTLVSNGQAGLKVSASGGRTIGMTKLENNIVASNGGYSVRLSVGVSVDSVNHNLHFGTGALLSHHDRDKTWAEWQSLGFDTFGVNANPRLDAEFVPLVDSRAIDAGASQGEVAFDKNGAARSGVFDIGAFEFGSTANVPPGPPNNVRIIFGAQGMSH
jgi:hypothetical protein